MTSYFDKQAKDRARCITKLVTNFGSGVLEVVYHLRTIHCGYFANVAVKQPPASQILKL